ncbi:MAG: Bax inhibitor-1/YccA family protein [Treponema sp.]|nr:Bax inhibitor-1/YccA family protein [Treponema sp.]
MAFDTTQVRTQVSAQKKFMTRVYGWMALALTLSFASAFGTARAVSINQTVAQLLYNGIGMTVLIIAELALVFTLSAAIRKISVGGAIAAFIAYSVINGMTLSSIFLYYRLGSIALIFLVSALMFGAMSIYGVTTDQNLASTGRYLMMALIGIIIASVINLFLHSSGFAWVISLVTVVVFTGITAYDTQRMFHAAAYADDSALVQKASIIGALKLYLDFINIFLSLLRLFGRRR